MSAALVLVGLVALVGATLTLFSGFGLGTVLLPVFSLYLPVELGTDTSPSGEAGLGMLAQMGAEASPPYFPCAFSKRASRILCWPQSTGKARACSGRVTASAVSTTAATGSAIRPTIAVKALLPIQPCTALE